MSDRPAPALWWALLLGGRAADSENIPKEVWASLRKGSINILGNCGDAQRYSNFRTPRKQGSMVPLSVSGFPCLDLGVGQGARPGGLRADHRPHHPPSLHLLARSGSALLLLWAAPENVL